MDDSDEEFEILFGDTSSSSSEELIGQVLMANRIHEMQKSQQIRRPLCTSNMSGRQYLLELLNGHPDRLFYTIRMDVNTFRSLCRRLVEMEVIEHDRVISVEEAVVMFLWIVTHNQRVRTVAERYQHSVETVCRQFGRVLDALCYLGNEVIRPLHFNTVQAEIQNNSKYFPWFKDCVGAIDGTHVSAVAPALKQLAYRGRKVDVTQNVMAACSFNMMFTYVYAGWEGTANDSRVLLDAIRKDDNFPMPPPGKYYVVDSGYPNMPGFLAPYRGERYHLRRFRGRGNHPRGAMELFNYRHSSLRNVIERCFGLLKARFPILKSMPPYLLGKQRRIPIACCTIHNWIKMHSINDRMFEQYSVDATPVEDIEGTESQSNTTIENQQEGDEAGISEAPQINFSQAYMAQMENVRDDIARQMWFSYNNNV
ncbi:protein ALP1-like [Humulus lupulus]|uniref:protein ALP1-like n=1 Tax=Humulus lupulus TaxID=3486 RepID=UPI002B40380C|nr:protein ALP1-like [Humulus lupulus]